VSQKKFLANQNLLVTTLNLNLIYLTVITKQALKLILILLFGTNVCVHVGGNRHTRETNLFHIMVTT